MSSIMLEHETRNIDRISALPDELICHVLSSLRTVEVLQTMVLSKRWKTIWASVSSLDFDDERDFGRDYGFEDFKMAVSRALYLRDPSCIQKLRLVISSAASGHFGAFDDWINIAVRSNVVELDLHMLFPLFVNRHGFRLPEGIFMCKTLRVLRLFLGHQVWTEPPTSGCCFPSLKLLHVTVYNPCGTTMKYLFSCCPVLEDLTIDGSIGGAFLGKGHFKVSTPELKTLRINLATHIDPVLVYIDTPKLESIDLKSVGSIMEFVLMGSVKSLVNASFAFSEWHELQMSYNFAMELMDQVSIVKSLSFSAHCLKDRLFHKDWQPPIFGNVKTTKSNFRGSQLLGIVTYVSQECT